MRVANAGGPYSVLERAMGIEPTSKAWEAFVLPLNYARNAHGFYRKYLGPPAVDLRRPFRHPKIASGSSADTT